MPLTNCAFLPHIYVGAFPSAVLFAVGKMAPLLRDINERVPVGTTYYRAVRMGAWGLNVG